MDLEALGLSAAEASAYEWLVARPSATVEDLAPPGTAGVLAALEAKGLATRSGPARRDYVASPPTVALGALVRERRDELRRAESRMADLVDSYRAGTPGRSVGDVVEVVTDRAAVAQRFAQIQAGAQQEVLAFVLPEIVAVSGEENVEEDQAIDRGVRYRVVAERAVLDRPGFLAAAEEIAVRGGGVRAVATLPSRLMIADRSLAMVPVGAVDEVSAGGALLIHTSPLLDLLIDVFETHWAHSTEVVPRSAGAGAEALEPPDDHILRLLAIGLTDRAVATQLGLSMRTVQRRVRALMDQAEVDSRFQLGAAAARRGWVA
jgi:sugar-specific transcriptional regulator TrmB/DNA-binding CsgD family transcriptional regulator